jgi:hypothetical protein
MVRSIEIRNWAALIVLEFELSAMADLGKGKKKIKNSISNQWRFAIATMEQEGS